MTPIAIDTPTPAVPSSGIPAASGASGLFALIVAGIAANDTGDATGKTLPSTRQDVAADPAPVILPTVGSDDAIQATVPGMAPRETGKLPVPIVATESPRLLTEAKAPLIARPTPPEGIPDTQPAVSLAPAKIVSNPLPPQAVVEDSPEIQAPAPGCPPKLPAIKGDASALPPVLVLRPGLPPVPVKSPKTSKSDETIDESEPEPAKPATKHILQNVAPQPQPQPQPQPLAIAPPQPVRFAPLPPAPAAVRSESTGDVTAAGLAPSQAAPQAPAIVPPAQDPPAPTPTSYDATLFADLLDKTAPPQPRVVYPLPGVQADAPAPAKLSIADLARSTGASAILAQAQAIPSVTALGLTPSRAADKVSALSDPAPAMIDSSIQPTPAVAMPAHVAAKAAAVADHPLDTARADWIAAMVDRIDEMRTHGGDRAAHIKLLPGALGTVEVRIEHRGETMNVSFSADNAHARALLTDAAPKLVQLAEARGLKLGNTSVDQGQAQDRRPALDAPEAPLAPPPAADTTDSELVSGSNVGRIA